MTTKQLIREAIYSWVEQNFGPHEVMDPSWDIDGLAEALASCLSKADIRPEELSAYTKNNIYDDLREHFLEEDIEQVAEDRGLALTKKDIAEIKRRYYKLDDETWEQIAIIMDDIAIERKTY